MVPRLIVVATTELSVEEVRAGRTARLHELENELLFLMVKLLADDAAARRAMSDIRG